MFLAQKIYRLYFHPLADIPGPKLWAVSRLPFIYSMLSGNHVHDVRSFHEKYGDAVRLAPNEVSFAAPEAWHEIFDYRPNHQTFTKDPMWFKLPNGQQDSGMLQTTIIDDHVRMRKLMDPAFSYKSLKAQEAIIQSYVTLLMTKLREKAVDAGAVNMVDWFNFTIFDIVGDLAFGESFGCLQDSRYHAWIAMIFNYIKSYVFGAMTRYYPIFEAIFMKSLPKSILDAQQKHYQYAANKIHRRLNLETQRNDFVTPMIEDNKDMQSMTMPEIESTLNSILVAGSETTATTLAGIINKLVQHPRVLQRLVLEVRGKFPREEDITMAATKDLLYLNACISEGLRTCGPVPGGMPRVAPAAGATVCGRWLPGKVRNLPSLNRYSQIISKYPSPLTNSV